MWNAWPGDEPVLQVPVTAPPPALGTRMRLYRRVDHYEPGLGDRGERHLVQLWPARPSPPVHAELTAVNVEDRAYAEMAARPVEEYTRSYTITHQNPECGSWASSWRTPAPQLRRVPCPWDSSRRRR